MLPLCAAGVCPLPCNWSLIPDPGVPARTLQFSLAQAGFHSMAYHFAGAFLGVLAGSRIADHLAGQRPTIRMEINLLGLLLGVPSIFWIGHSANTLSVFCALGFFGLFRGLYDSNLFASLYDVVDPRLRASATGLMLSFAFVVGCSAPTILGWMKTKVGLGAGLSFLCWFYLFGAACIFVALKCFRKRDAVSSRSNPG